MIYAKISLSSWFRDYVYIPLGGSKISKQIQIRNIVIIFLLSGFWHGANWTFIIWGLFHALFSMPLLLSKKNKEILSDTSYNLLAYFKMLLTFFLVSFGWVFFRAKSLTEAILYFIGMTNYNNLSLHYFYSNAKFALLTAICFFAVIFLIGIEWKNFIKGNQEVKLNKVTVFFLLFLLFCMGTYRNQMSFIYFQF